MFFDITDNLISTIEYSKCTFILTLYKKKNVIFRKAYTTLKGAKIAQTKLIRKYNL